MNLNEERWENKLEVDPPDGRQRSKSFYHVIRIRTLQNNAIIDSELQNISIRHLSTSITSDLSVPVIYVPLE